MFYKEGFEKRQSINQKYSSRLKKNPTKSEVVFKEKLDKLKIRYMFQKGFCKGDFSCIVDFYLPKPFKICIEIDGGYHLDEKQKWRDHFKNKYLKETRGFKVLRLTNKEAEDISLKELRSRIYNI